MCETASSSACKIRIFSHIELIKLFCNWWKSGAVEGSEVGPHEPGKGKHLSALCSYKDTLVGTYNSKSHLHL